MMLLEYMGAIISLIWLGALVVGVVTFGLCIWLVHPNAKANRQDAERRAREKEETDRALLESGFEP